MEVSLEKILENNHRLESRYSKQIEINEDLNRALVSFQANKTESGYRWYKFKEGYSSALVDYLISKLTINSGSLIDPFAGSGTSLFVAAKKGLNAVGIELLPLCSEIIETRKIIYGKEIDYYADKIKGLIETKAWEKKINSKQLNELNITKGAYPDKTKKSIEQYLAFIEDEKDKNLVRVMLFVLLCILEEISYTRKDGQYLRWDHRSGKRGEQNNFNKGYIKDFSRAILDKLNILYEDLSSSLDLFTAIKKEQGFGDIKLLTGSCLSVLPKLKGHTFDILVTSPPYCNRYDYTRTYALELALLGLSENELKSLRQDMLSCTVENREKDHLHKFLSSRTYSKASKAFEEQEDIRDILNFLEWKKAKNELNNTGIARMVRNYFYEMTFVIFECGRVLKQGAPFVMVNDNVRYAGAPIPVDLILSDIATKADFEVEKIWVLPNGKGNSSQQMGRHGREELRKCVYIWRRL